MTGEDLAVTFSYASLTNSEIELVKLAIIWSSWVWAGHEAGLIEYELVNQLVLLACLSCLAGQPTSAFSLSELLAGQPATSCLKTAYAGQAMLVCTGRPAKPCWAGI